MSNLGQRTNRQSGGNGGDRMMSQEPHGVTDNSRMGAGRRARAARVAPVPLSNARSWLMDMDGVLVREEAPIPGADLFLARLRELGLPHLVLTNNSIYTQRDLSARLAASGHRGTRRVDLDLGARHGAVPG